MRGRESLRIPVYVLEKSGGATGILIGTQICACLILPTPAKSSQLLSPLAMCTGWHKGGVVLGLQVAQDAQGSPAVPTLFQASLQHLELLLCIP